MKSTTPTPRPVPPRTAQSRTASLSPALALVVLLFSAGVPVLLAQDPIPEELQARQQELAGRLDRYFNGSLVAGGSVLDADGRPLENVTLLIEIGRFDPREPSMRRGEKERRVVTGAFRVTCDECSDMRLRFLKEGYHGELLTLATRSEVSAPESEARPTKSQGRLQVVMQPVTAPVELERFRARLTLASEGRERVLPLAVSDTEGRAAGRETPLKALRQKAGPLPAYLRLAAALDEGGAPKIEKSRPTDQPRAVAPALELEGEGGFLLYRPEAVRDEEIWREMDRAPEGGYAPRLELDPQADRPIYFFLRAGDTYGKGKITPATVERGTFGHRVSAFVELRLNPDGGRGLESARF